MAAVSSKEDLGGGLAGETSELVGEVRGPGGRRTVMHTQEYTCTYTQTHKHTSTDAHIHGHIHALSLSLTHKRTHGLSVSGPIQCRNDVKQKSETIENAKDHFSTTVILTGIKNAAGIL